MSGGDSGVISRIIDAFPVRPVLADEQMLENVRSALARGLPGPSLCRPHDQLMSIAAGGPSLEDTWRELSGVTCAVNGSLRFLLEKDVTPWAVGCMDPRPHMADTLEARDGVFYFIASTCHPSVFEKLKNQIVILWHPLGMPGMMEVIGPRTGIGGGTTMGLRWLTLGHYMGFRRFDCHGLDSSFRGKATHAYPDWRDNFDAHELMGFKTSLNFVQQVQDWFELKEMFADLPPEHRIETKLYGDGLLQHCAREHELNPPAPRDVAVYDLGRCPASWDFINWLASVDIRRRVKGLPLKVRFAAGPNEGFRHDGLPVNAQGRQQLLDRVCKPLVELLGGEVISDRDPVMEHAPPSYLMGPVCDAVRSGHVPPDFLADVKPSRGDKPVVITLREAEHWPERNSNLAAWQAFVNRLSATGEHVVVVRDTARASEPLPGWDCEIDVDAAIDLTWRAKLYASAKCCLFTCNGPAHLAVYSQVPWLMFGPLADFPAGTPEWWRHAIGVPVGTQYPWAGSAQRIIWAPDTLEDIETAWASLLPLLNEPAAKAA